MKQFSIPLSARKIERPIQGYRGQWEIFAADRPEDGPIGILKYVTEGRWIYTHRKKPRRMGLETIFFGTREQALRSLARDEEERRRRFADPQDMLVPVNRFPDSEPPPYKSSDKPKATPRGITHQDQLDLMTPEQIARMKELQREGKWIDQRRLYERRRATS